MTENRKLLPNRIGYDALTLHGKFRSYRPDVSRGDNLTHYSLGDYNPATGTSDTLILLPPDTIRDGVEFPTFWSRLPLSIQPNNDDQHLGLYSIHDKGTSLIFKKPAVDIAKRDGMAERLETNMRQCTAGVYVAFETNSRFIKIKYNYMKRGFVPHGRSASGFDIYEIENGEPVFRKNFRSESECGTFCYETGGLAEETPLANVTSLPAEKYSASKETPLANVTSLPAEKSSASTSDSANASALADDFSKYIVFLPTYNGFEFDLSNEENPSGLTFEFEESSLTYEFEPFAESERKPILIYGTSITQGDGSDGLRPGATYATQIMLAAKREVVNIGVAGSAQLEYKMADFLSQIESHVFVIDAGWNLTATSFAAESCTACGSPADISNDEIVSRIKYMVEKYRAANPETPIVICPKYLKKSDSDVNGGKSKTPPANIKMPLSFHNENGYFYSREGFLLYKAFLELQESGLADLFWAEQGATENGLWLSGSDLHPPESGMTDIAKWILPYCK